MVKIKRTWQLTYPLFLGYISVGFVFGMMTVSSGFSWVYATLSSVFLYAGASQFLLVNSVKNHLPYLDIFISVLLLNLRHIFYYKPIERKIESSGPKRWYSILALTDEVFAVLSDNHVTQSDSFLVLLFTQSYWILGTFLGANFGRWLVSSNLQGLDFSLIALFTVLFIEKLNVKKDRIPLAICFLLCLSLWCFVPSSFFLLTAIVGCLVLTSWLENSHG